MERIALGRLGIGLRELYDDYDSRTFMNHLNGYWDHIRTRHQNEWEVGRAFTFHLLNIQLESKNKFRKIGQFMTFPWEAEHKQKEEKKPLTIEQKQQLKQLFDVNG